MGKKYLNPPIIEAVCEFRFPSDLNWASSLPEAFFSMLQKDFPLKDQRVLQQVEVVQNPSGIEQRITRDERTIILAKDRKRFVQLGNHLLTVNCLKPYPSWEAYMPIIEGAFSTLKGINNFTILERVGLRYINKIEISGSKVELERYFGFRPHVDDRLPGTSVSSFILGCILPFRAGQDWCKVQLTDAVPANQGNSAFILDLDYFHSKPEGIDALGALAWIEDAHNCIEEIFEACITDELRVTFEEKK